MKLALAFCLVAAGVAHADQLDQSAPWSPNSGWIFVPSQLLAQTFTAGQSGSLSSVALPLASLGATTDLIVSIRDTQPLTEQSGRSFFSIATPLNFDRAAQLLPASSIPGSPQLVSISFSPPVQISAGSIYAIVLAFPAGSDPDAEVQWAGTGARQSDPYSGGTTFQIAGGPWRDVGDELGGRGGGFFADLGFETFTGCSPLTACPAGLDCGSIPDGCGGTITCGSRGGDCAAGFHCGDGTPVAVPMVAVGGGGASGGTPNVCGCIPFANLGGPASTLRGDFNCAGNAPPAGTTVQGNLNVPANASCALDGVSVRGNVQAASGATFTARSSVIGGNVQANNAAHAEIDSCSTVGGNFQAQGTAAVGVAGSIHGNVQLQKTSGPSWICSASIGGNLEVQQSSAAASFEIGGWDLCGGDDAIGNNAQLQQNAGPISFDGNSVGGNLQCQQNASIESSQNSVGHDTSGQCISSPIVPSLR